MPSHPTPGPPASRSASATRATTPSRRARASGAIPARLAQSVPTEAVRLRAPMASARTRPCRLESGRSSPTGRNCSRTARLGICWSTARLERLRGPSATRLSSAVRASLVSSTCSTTSTPASPARQASFARPTELLRLCQGLFGTGTTMSMSCRAVLRATASTTFLLSSRSVRLALAGRAVRRTPAPSVWSAQRENSRIRTATTRAANAP
mmetsp:Transcript_46414/g.108988  ORF Transcript_46414/g.108988 Transcript_46414/m.108988 type:complete len:210 (-) Transcript_46414:6640-7269(-)